jgi:hypothetical protein
MMYKLTTYDNRLTRPDGSQIHGAKQLTWIHENRLLVLAYERLADMSTKDSLVMLQLNAARDAIEIVSCMWCQSIAIDHQSSVCIK